MKFLANLTLWKKITIFTGLGLALGVGVFSFLSMRAVYRATEAMLQDRLTTAHMVADYVDEALNRALYELESSVQIVDRVGVSSIPSQMESLESAYARLSLRTCGIYLIGESGKILWSKTQGALNKNIDVSSYPEINHAISANVTTVSRIVSAPDTGTPVILLISPVSYEGAGEKVSLTVAIDLAESSVGLFIKPIRLGQTGYVEIVDQSGTVITRTEPGPKLAPFEKSDHSGRFAALINAGKPTRGICHTCHEANQKVESRDVLAFVPLSNAHWGVVLRQSEDEALAATGELRQNLFLFGIGLAVVALLFIIILARDIGGRIRLLTVASRRIASGDLKSPVATSGKDEIGVLAHTFDDMRSKLQFSYDTLEQKTKELSSLLSVAEILTSPLELPCLLDAVVTKAVEVIPSANGGVLLLASKNRDILEVQSAIGLEKSSLPRMPVANDNGQEAEDIVGNAVSAFLQSGAWHSGVQSLILSEIVHRKKHVGSLIVVSFKLRNAFADSDRRLLQAIADYIVIAIERDQLIKEADEARALHEADRLRSQFISSVSHELRTPLTVIKGYATSLLRKDVSWDVPSQLEFLQVIDAKTDELRDLIDKILQSAKLEAGALRLEREPLLMPQLARLVVSETEQRIKTHRFTVDFPPGFPVVEADTHCIEQVLRNLVENAVKYSPQGGQIIVKGEVKDSQVVVSVKDEGIGIPPECRDKVFERFYRAKNAICLSVPGCGLGLSICRGHVEAHHGKIWFESVPGKGSVFYFSLPVVSIFNEGSIPQEVAIGKENINPAG